MGEYADAVFDEGGIWEMSEWRITFDHECSYANACRHCHSHEERKNIRSDGSAYVTHHFVCPRVVIAINEGGCNSTGVCLDCVLEGAATLAKARLEDTPHA